MGLLSILGGVGSAAAGYELANDIRGVGESAASQMGELAGQLQSDSAFQGYGVTTGLGKTTVGSDGSTNLGVGPDQAMLGQGQQMYSGANQMFGSAAQMAQMSA